MAGQTPVEDILIDTPHLRVRAEMLFNKLGVKTAEEISHYNIEDLKMQNVGPKTINYIRECLASEGLELKESVPTPRRAFERYGTAKATEDVLEALRLLSNKYPNAYFSVSSIGEAAEDYARKSIPQTDFRESRRVFKHQNVNAMLVKGGALENFLESVDVFVGDRDITFDNSKTARVYRLKQPQGAK